MPVKIVPNSDTTNNLNGTINQQDLQTMIDTYKNDAAIKSKSDTNKQYFRFHKAFVDKLELLRLLDSASEGGGINIHFGITLSTQVGCDATTDIGDMLTI